MKYYLIVDLEATCCKERTIARSHPSSVGMHTRVTTTKPTSKNK